MRPDPFFSGSAIDRADLLRADSGKLAELITAPGARELRWSDGFPEVADDGQLAWGRICSPDLFLGMDGGRPCFSPIVSTVADAYRGFHVLASLNPEKAPLFATALSLSGWHARHGFCANCGAGTQSVRGGWSRRCMACGAEHFPRVDPVVIMLAEHRGNVLLGRQPQYPPQRYSALAGFVEVGESIEAAVARELEEEAGISVDNVRYASSQPWPFPSSLMIACTAEARDSALVIDTTELEDARWFSREEVVSALSGEHGASFQPPPRFAIARTLLESWLAA